MKKEFSLAAAGNPELPPNNNPGLRWTPQRKEAVILHILDQKQGLLKSREAALEHYYQLQLTPEELDGWIDRFLKGSRNALRSTQVGYLRAHEIS